MDGSVVDAASAAISSAIGAYGHGVLSRAEDAAADETVRLGQRLLARLRGAQKDRDQIDQVVADVARRPGHDSRAAVRALIIHAVEADPSLAADLRAIVQDAGARIIASGERSVAVQHNSGVISTGDGATIHR